MVEKSTNIKERVIQFAKNQGVSVDRFIHSIGMSYGSFKGKSRESALNSDAVAEIITKYPNANPEWLLLGVGKMTRDDAGLIEPTDPSQRLDTRTKNKGHRIPLIPIEAISRLTNNGFSIPDQEIQDSYVVPDFFDADYMIRVRDSSMYPKFRSGDVVACKAIRDRTFIQWNKPHVIFTEAQGIMIKRIRKSNSRGNVMLMSENPDYEPFEVPEEKIISLALVNGLIRHD